MRHVWKVAVVAVAAVAVLAGCGNDPGEPGGPEGVFRVATVDVDGRDVTCITWKQGYAGGISSDWAGASDE